MMIEVKISYGKKFLSVRVPEKNLLDYACLPDVPGVANEAEAITRAIKNPIEMESLEKLAAAGQKIAIIVDDITRPSPTHKFLPPIVKELESAGIKDEDITVVFATGSHRPHTNEEKQFLLGAEYASRFKTIDHDANDKGGMVFLGHTSRGTPVEVNKHLAEADLKILTGLIKPHSYAGYSGGGKSLLPGVCSMDTIIADHDYDSTLHPNALVGHMEGNPIRVDIEEAALLVDNCFIVNGILNSKKEIVAVVAGDMIKAHREGAKLLDTWAKVPVKGPADIVIAGCSHPTSISYYQAANAISHCVRIPQPIVRPGGTVIVAAPCPDGLGSDGPFYDLVKEASNPGDVLEKLRQPGFFVHDQWAAQSYCGDLMVVNLIMVTDAIDQKTVEDMLATYAPSVKVALDMALEKLGPQSKVTVLSDSPYIIPVLVK